VRGTKHILGEGVDLQLFTSSEAEDVSCGLDECCLIRSAQAPVRRFSSRWLAARLSRNPERMDILSFAPVVDAARRGGLMLSIGGDNYCYGVNRHMLLVNRFVRRAGARTVLWGCSIEPEALDIPEVRDDLAAFDAIVARESITRDMLLAAGFDNVTLRPDPAFVLERSDEPLPPGFVAGNTVGVNISPMIISHETHAGATLAGYEQLVEHILATSDMSVALIPHVVWSHNDDRRPLGRLLAKFAHTGRVVMTDDAPAPVLKGYIARCRFFVAARTHASIAAYSECVPTLVAGYSVKARGIARDIFGSESGYVIPVQSLRTGGELVEAFEWIRGREMEIRDLYSKVMAGYRDAAGCNYGL
jgi:polysaccharide pyruvyl transferase WcaK-like protein